MNTYIIYYKDRIATDTVKAHFMQRGGDDYAFILDEKPIFYAPKYGVLKVEVFYDRIPG